MKLNPDSVVRSMAAAVPLLAAALASGPAWAADASASGEQIRMVDAQKLPNVPGKTLTALVVSYAPGGRSAPHHHPGSVWAFVLSGSIRSENSATGPVRVYKAERQRERAGQPARRIRGR